MVPYGISISGGILIGKSIGEGNKSAVKHYFKQCLQISLGVALF
jgi:Na+-driven multidrug efflux pump